MIKHEAVEVCLTLGSVIVLATFITGMGVILDGPSPPHPWGKRDQWNKLAAAFLVGMVFLIIGGLLPWL